MKIQLNKIHENISMNINRKKIMVLAVFLNFVFLLNTGYAASPKSENAVFSEISSAYENEFYPGVVKYSENFRKKFPNSTLIGKVFLYEGESLFRISKFGEAKNTLTKALVYFSDDENSKLKVNYWLARTCYELNEYSAAKKYFYEAALSSKSRSNSADSPEKEIYASSVLYGARICSIQKDFTEGEKLLLYVVSNGNSYSKNEYEEACVLLFNSYAEAGENQKTVDLYKKLRLENFSDGAKSRINLIYGQTEEKLMNFIPACTAYEKIAIDPDSEFSAQALQKLDMLYLRIGIDCFSSGNYADSEKYLSKISKNAASYISDVKNLYQAQLIVAAGFGSIETRAFEAEKILLARLNSIKDEDLQDSYYKQLARFSGLQNKWESCLAYSEKIKAMDSSSYYWKAMAEQNGGNYSQAVKDLENYTGDIPAWKYSVESKCLYALVLAKSGNQKSACSVFEELEKLQQLNDEMKLNYARLLIETGDNIKAIEVSVQVERPVSLYYQGLANFNLKNWKEAEKLFENYCKTPETGNRGGTTAEIKQKSFAKFYLGIAQYRNSDFGKAYENLFEFAKENPENSLAWYAYSTSATAAFHAGKMTEAQNSAEKALASAKTEKEKQDSVIQSSSIYADCMEYSKAEKLLQPYLKQNNDFAIKCAFSLAQIYETQGKIKESDSVYSIIAGRKTAGNYAEEASYRRGELYYSVKDYKTASQKFSDYLARYSYGKFTDSAMYYKADCLIQTNQKDKAVLQLELLLNSNGRTNFRYSSMKKLCEIYKESGNYEESLSYARKMLKEFPEQAKDEKIDLQEKELARLAKGTDSRIVAKISEYEKNGGLNSEKGRKSGTELALLYAANEDFLEQAVKLSGELLPLQKKNLSKECAFAAENAFLLARNSRKLDKNKESADFYLEAAEYFRMAGNEQSAAQALYGAVEAFDAASLYGDARETAGLLEKLYPESRQNIAAKRIINRSNEN